MAIDRRGFLAGALSLGSLHAARAAPAELVLGYLTAGSGPFVSLSRSNRIAAAMAVEEINAQGGIGGRRLRLVEFDTAGRAEQAVAGLRKLAADEGALAVIGPFSTTECQVAFPQGERLMICTMSMASSAPGLSAPYSYAFRNNMGEQKMFASVVETIRSKGLPATSAAIAYATDDAVSKAVGTKVMPAALRQAQIPVEAVVDFRVADFDFAPQVSKLMGRPTDLVAVGAPPEAAINLAREMRRQGHRGRLIAGATIFDVELPQRMGAGGDGTIVPTTFWWQLNDRTRAFAAEFETRAKAAGLQRTRPAQFDASTHSIVHLYARALAATNATGDPARLEQERRAVRDALQTMAPAETIEGVIAFDRDRDAVKPAYVMQIDQSGWTLLQTFART